MTIIKAERATVKFFEGLEIDGYRMPSGEFRVSMAGASVLLGYQRNWLSRSISRGGSTIKALQGTGFSAEIVETGNPALNGGGVIGTISLQDFQKLLIYGVQEKRAQAIALQMGLTEMSLTDFFRDAFGLRPLSIDEKRIQLYKSFATTLTAQDWLEWDRQDALDIEEHLVFLGEG